MRFTKIAKEKALYYIKDNVVDKVTKKVVDAADKSLSEQMSKILIEKFPQNEMKILLKYNRASAVKEIQLGYGYGYAVVHNIPNILIPSSYHDQYTRLNTSDSGHNYFFSINEEIEKYKSAWHRHIDANKLLREKYAKLFDSCTNFKQLATFWPECTILFPDCLNEKKKISSALIALNKDDLNWIRLDSMKRVKERSQT